MSAPRRAHVPVLLGEMLAALAPADGDWIVDGTFGAGGYSAAILTAADCRVIALDRDPAAIAEGAGLAAAHAGRLHLLHARFADLAEEVPRELGRLGRGADEGAADGLAGGEADAGAALVDGIVLDIGVSSMQLDRPERGFSFQADGPLDMRMGTDGLSAADVVAGASEAELADIIFHLGEDRLARRIARAIVRAREEAAITRTGRLAAVVERAVGRQKGDERHPATRTFQALRIHVNDELGELAAALAGAERILRPGGRLVVVTFHSLEDRVVKRFLARRGRAAPAGSRHAPPTPGEAAAPPSFRIVNQRPIDPSDDEIAANPRARSAKLRAAVRTSAPAWPPERMADLGIPVPGGRGRAR